MMQARDGYFVSGEVRLRYRDEGAGAPVVFIHGWTLDLDVWNPQAEALAGAIRVIRFDRRGFGRSEGVPSLDADREDLLGLLEHLGLRDAALVGASQGARVALDFAICHAERVAGVVLDGPPNEIGDDAGLADEDFSVEAFRQLVRERGVDAFRRAWSAHPLMRLHCGDAAARALLASMLARYPARDLIELAAARAPPQSAAVLARLRKPVLVLNGQFDTAVRLHAGERLCRVLPDAERIVVAGAGHLPNLDSPGEYNEAIRAFLRRRSRVAA